jgi:hypothetical protein
MNKRFNPGAGIAGLLASSSLILAACVGGGGGSPLASPTAGPTASTPVATSPGYVAPPSIELMTSPAPTSTSVPTAAPSTLVLPASPPASAPPLAGPQITETDNGHTLRIHAGSELKLILHNTYWQIVGSSSTAVLAPVGAAVYSGAGLISCIPGSGCGTVTQVFRAAGLGQATLTASRTSCGEVLQCTGTAGSFKVTIVVDA